jgi:hypothetical protein
MLNTTTARGTSVIEIGAGVAGLAAPRRAIRTGWDSDPFSLDAYSFAAVNASSEDHVTLAKPAGSRLFHACNDPAESAHFKPLMQMPQRVFSYPARSDCFAAATAV